MKAIIRRSMEVSSKEVCRENKYVNGSWVIDKQITKKSFYCCQNDDVGTVAYCGDKVVGNENKFYPHEDLVIAPDKACACDNFDGTRNTVSTREQYKWVPELCRLESFTGQQFCSVLGKRRLLLIGDSLMHQLASALINVLKTLDAPCLGQISYGKSSHLKYQARNPNAGTGYDGNQNMRMFFEKNMGADICLVNTGAHLDDGGDLYDIWENIQPWVNEYKNFALLDISMLRLRPDAHKSKRIPGHDDCLHWCFPGPLDIFATILYNKLSVGEI
eukprot:gene28642-37852_t